MNIGQYEKLSISFYTGGDVVQIAKDLIGKYLFSKIDGRVTGGRIVETEAYDGRRDKACHAFHKRTPRTEVMYEEGGRAYIYLCYGIHHLFNVVTNKKGLADAVLIRAIEPVIGLIDMSERRKITDPFRLCAGPGKLSQAMGLNYKMSGTRMSGSEIWIASSKSNQETLEIISDVRIGIDYAEEDALLPWRFYLAGSNFVSKKKTPT